MFLEALFIIAMIWKQSKCPSTDEQIKKIISNGILLSYKKKNEILHCSNVDEAREYV